MEKIVQNHLKDIRKMLGITQTKLADYLGYARQNIWNLEHGLQPLSRVQLYAIFYLIENILQRNDVEDYIRTILQKELFG